MEIKLAEALLRRKELQTKVDQLKHLKDNNVFYQIQGKRVKVTEGIEEITALYPKLEASQVTAEYDWAARQLRLIDAAIQNANWTTCLNVDDNVMRDFSDLKQVATAA